MAKRKRQRLSVCERMCGTCPFRPDSPHADLAAMLSESVLTDRSRICHSTGRNNAIHRRTGKPPQICRGARDLQLKMFHTIGFISEPTDAAWDAKCLELKLP